MAIFLWISYLNFKGVHWTLSKLSLDGLSLSLLSFLISPCSPYLCVQCNIPDKSTKLSRNCFPDDQKLTQCFVIVLRSNSRNSRKWLFEVQIVCFLNTGVGWGGGGSTTAQT